MSVEGILKDSEGALSPELMPKGRSRLSMQDSNLRPPSAVNHI